MTDDDKTLLELAAKAAGIDVIRFRLDDPLHSDLLIKTSARNGAQGYGPWSPLIDDGDEARLESILGLCVSWRPLFVRVFINARVALDDNRCTEYFKDHDEDKQAARRRAGVRCAAAIGTWL